ncbi:fimbrial protein [Enterobacteriaceae bacterium G50]|nr:fimbrial protein [Enterobacteriaceae bacterium G50]
MNKHCLALAVASVMGLFSVASSAAEVTVPGGKINFVGEVVDAACSVSSDSIDQTVILDQVNRTKLATAGAAAGQPKSFTIKLVDCSTDVYKNAAVTFTGQTDADVAAALANTFGAGGATHVALQMYGPDSQVINMGTASGVTKLQTGTNEMPFSVDYIATDAAATVGGVSATATFHITYS